jgi:uncharacterized lipoprotein YddW (UPF0748 family)
MKKLLLVACLFCFLKSTQAQPPKRELRAVWIASFSNIDWPSSRTLTPAQQRTELINMLNTLQQTGINAVFLQIRGNADALYPSTIEPWSDVLTGTSGTAPNPIYDPLQFAIDECRKRSMEFHAWFNPYRAASNANNIPNYATNHIARARPDLLLAQGTLRILNPGIPEVNNYIIRVVMDVLRRYDVDGIHFDDYFYPYPPTAPTLPFDDAATYNTFRGTFTNVNDWRRANIDSLIKRTADSVRTAKPWVKFGVSPFGIWANQSGGNGGSATSGLQSFSAIYANSRLWAQQQWLDYQIPQIYWSIGFAAANYSVLANWWNTNANGRHIYTGHAGYKINSPTEAGSDLANWSLTTQIPSQVQLNRTIANIFGSCYFSAKSIVNNPLGVRDSLSNNYYATRALYPTMAWKNNTTPPAPTNATHSLIGNTVTLNWNRPTTATGEFERVRQFVVYRFNGSTVNVNDASAIRFITPVDSIGFAETGLVTGQTYTYVITSLNRLHNESVASNTVTVTVNATAVQTLSALVATIQQNAPNPFTSTTVINYTLKKAMPLSIQLFDMQGKWVQTIFNGNRIIGNYTATIDGSNLQAGNYFVLFNSNEGQKTIPIVKQ